MSSVVATARKAALWRRVMTASLVTFYRSRKASTENGAASPVRRLACRQRRLDLLDQELGRLGAELEGDALAAAIGFADEIDVQRMVEGRVIGVIVIDRGAVDPHPAASALGAAGDGGFL